MVSGDHDGGDNDDGGDGDDGNDSDDENNHDYDDDGDDNDDDDDDLARFVEFFPAGLLSTQRTPLGWRRTSLMATPLNTGEQSTSS